MAKKHVIAVMGATGAQGGGLVRAVLADRTGDWSVRAVTRHPDSEKGQALRAAGADVVAGDMDDPKSLERAFAGADAAFCVTNFWEHLNPEREIEQARHQAAALRPGGVGYAIWSTLEDTRKDVPVDDARMPTLLGRYKVPHFDTKGEADAFFMATGVPTTLYRTSFYWDNLIHFGMGPRRGEDGSLSFVLPIAGAKLPGIAAADIGKCAYGLLKRHSEFTGRTVGVAGEHLTGEQLAAGLARVLGERVQHVALPPAVFRGLGFPGAEDLGNMFQYNTEFSDQFCRARSVELSRSLNPELQTYDQWLDRNKESLKVH
ncbi:MAG: NmrA/HSCARG family protein [Gemmatimonadales bacterium]|nr:NmrA/HSCARG family protein [Gemmatimonadales bacterium]